MAVRRVAGRWCVEFQQSGIRVFRRCPAFAGKADATALEVRLRREIFTEQHLDRKAEPSLAAAIQLWLESETPRFKDQVKPVANARYLAEYVAGKRLRQAPEAAQEAMKAWHELKPATVNRRLAVLKAACRHAYHQGWISENLSGRIRLLREENRREVYLTASQVRSLSEAAPTFACRAAIMIAAYTGLRSSELLRIGKTSSRSVTLLVGMTKTGRPRSVPVASTIRKYLEALSIDMTYTQLEWQFREARRKAGMHHIRFHDLRHTCASMLINKGVDLYTVGRILGHSTPVTTARYAHLSDKTLRDAMRKLA